MKTTEPSKTTRNNKFRKKIPFIGAKSEKLSMRQKKIHSSKFENLATTKNRKRKITINEDKEEEEEEEDAYASDFSEFDDEEVGKKITETEMVDQESKNNGIAVRDLPYRPAIDIYDLERLSYEEFCPLTLDDDDDDDEELNCDDTYAWP